MQYSSPIYHLKWFSMAYEIKDSPYQLEAFQNINHYDKTTALTSKHGLTDAFSNLPKDYAGLAPVDQFFPKSFVIERKNFKNIKKNKKG